jgi:hypothetical protein
MSGLIIGNTYQIRHSRKGECRAVLRALHDGDDGSPTWADIELIKGRLKGIGAGSLRLPGEHERVRVCLCSFTPMTTAPEWEGQK